MADISNADTGTYRLNCRNQGSRSVAGSAGDGLNLSALASLRALLTYAKLHLRGAGRSPYPMRILHQRLLGAEYLTSFHSFSLAPIPAVVFTLGWLYLLYAYG